MKIETIGKPEACKLIRIRAEIEDNIVTFIQIRGDFFASPEEGFDTIEEKLRGIPLNNIGKRFNELVIEEKIEVYGISGEGLDAVLQNAEGLCYEK